MEKPNEAILSRIRKLQALAEGATTEAEAALALFRVHELLGKYNLDIGAVVLREDPGTSMLTGPEFKHLPPHYPKLAGACDEMFDVLHYYQRTSGEMVRWRRVYHRRCVFIGLTANVQTACATFAFLVDSIEILCKSWRIAWKKDPANAGLYSVDSISFRLGCADRIHQTATEYKTRLSGTLTTQELIHIGNAVAQKLYDQITFRGPGLGSNRFPSDHWAYAAGFDKGKDVDIHGARTNRMLRGGK